MGGSISRLLSSRLASGADGQAGSTVPSRRCDPAAQLDLPLIEQAAQPLHRRLLSPGEAILLAQQPVDLSLGDHPGAQALKEQLASGHRFVTDLLHSGG